MKDGHKGDSLFDRAIEVQREFDRIAEESHRLQIQREALNEQLIQFGAELSEIEQELKKRGSQAPDLIRFESTLSGVREILEARRLEAEVDFPAQGAVN